MKNLNPNLTSNYNAKIIKKDSMMAQQRYRERNAKDSYKQLLIVESMRN